jgi:hypothetical protein
MPRPSLMIPRRDFLRTSAGLALLPYLPGNLRLPAGRRRSQSSKCAPRTAAPGSPRASAIYGGLDTSVPVARSVAD